MFFSIPTSALFADEPPRVVRHDGGYLADFSDESYSGARVSESRAFSDFNRRHFADMRRDAYWQTERSFSDSTHVHRIFRLQVQGRPVEGELLKTHFNRRGFIEYASSTWTGPATVKMAERADVDRDKENIEASLRAELVKRYGNDRAKIIIEPVWWKNTDRELIAAFAVTLTHYGPLAHRIFIADQTTGKVLEEKKAVRYSTDVTANVYDINPLVSSLATRTIAELYDPGTALSNNYMHVRRQQNIISPTLVEVNPTVDYSATFQTDPLSYDYACNGASCPNQQFDAVNVAYHLDSYRHRLQTYFSTLNVTGDVAAKLNDPLEVIVNSLDVDFNGNGLGNDESNNAAFISTSCTDHATVADRCLVFLRPESITTSVCGGGIHEVVFFDLAREGNVIVHEFQHYITDRITGLVPGSSTTANVGDAIHEGYSDYFGTSHVTAVAGANATKVGEYAFQNCPFLIRDTAQLRVYENGEDERDSHIAGLSFASGLWRLRTTLGVEKADLLALKSLFFMPVRPGFANVIETLVKADKALNNSENVAAIRQLFYQDLKFVGGQSVEFRDISKAVVELGFHSCGSVHAAGRYCPWWSFGLFVFWLNTTLWLGRRSQRRV